MARPPSPGSPWLDEVAELVRTAPPWMRSLAAPELFVGGFTQVWLEVPVLALASLADEGAAERVVVFFLAACFCKAAGIARIECADRDLAGDLIAAAEASLAGAVRSIDGDNVGLMGYFDVYLAAPTAVAERDGRRIVERLTEAVRG